MKDKPRELLGETGHFMDRETREFLEYSLLDKIGEFPRDGMRMRAIRYNVREMGGNYFNPERDGTVTVYNYRREDSYENKIRRYFATSIQ